MGPDVRALGWTEFARDVSRVIVATSDSAILEVAATLASAGFKGDIALHTCGAKGPEALAPLRKTGAACGVLHPFQTFATPEQGVDSFSGITFGISGDVAALEWSRRIAGRLGAYAVEVSPGQLASYHAAAVLAGNGLTALMDAAARLLERAGFDRESAIRTI